MSNPNHFQQYILDTDIFSCKQNCDMRFNFFHRCRKKGSKALWENRSTLKSILFGGGNKEKKKKKKKGKQKKNKNKSK